MIYLLIHWTNCVLLLLMTGFTRACEDVYGTHVKGSAAPPSAAGGAGAGAGGRDRRYCTTSMFERAVQFITSCSGNSSNGTAATETGASRESTSGAKEGQQQSQMRQGTTRPFFLYLSPLSPHPPFIFPPAYQPLFDSLSPSIHITRRKVWSLSHRHTFLCPIVYD